MKEMFFTFGALSDKFSEQCERQGYRLKNAEKWDKRQLHKNTVAGWSRFWTCGREKPFRATETYIVEKCKTKCKTLETQ